MDNAYSTPPENGIEHDLEADTEAEGYGNGAQLNSETKRVNVSMSPAQHERYTSLADRMGLSFSALVRTGIERLEYRREHGASREIQPLVTRLEEVATATTDLEDQLEGIRATQSDVLEVVEEETAVDSTRDHSDEWIGRELYKVLTEDGPKTIPELVENTDFDREQIQRGLNHLRDTFTVESTNADRGTVWRCIDA